MQKRLELVDDIAVTFVSGGVVGEFNESIEFFNAGKNAKATVAVANSFRELIDAQERVREMIEK